ncbi:MAG: hypothetical protein VKM92_00920 [Cyanobacteriota bacterium]|nr:hypothetical protein [Cyanobacteriota bacterium]
MSPSADSRKIPLRTFPGLPPQAQAGYSLPLVLVVVLSLIAGAATLVARSGSIGFGSIFQKQSWEARSIAELGMATLVSRLNREENRYLLAAPPADVNPTYDRNSRWSTDATVLLANHSNPCADDPNAINPTTGLRFTRKTPPSINDIYPNGVRDLNDSRSWWYVNSSGQVSSSATNAVGKFRLIGEADDNNFRMAARRQGSEQLDFSQATGKSSIKLSVEAVALNANGSDKSRAVLEAVMDVVPKCCKTTFGNDHGSNDYRATYSSGNAFGNGACVPPINPDSFGIVYGISGGGGTLKTTGNATEVWRKDLDGSQTLINPVACIQTGDMPCLIDGTFNGISSGNTSDLLEVLNTAVPPAPVWYPGRPSGVGLPSPYQPLAASTANGLSVCSNSSNNGTDCRVITEADAATTTYFRFCLDNQCSRTYINGNAAASNLPSHCRYAPNPPLGDGALHCVVSRLSLGQGSKKLQFVTGVQPTGSTTPITKPIRVYFPQASATSGNQTDFLIDQSGVSWVEHCVLATTDPRSSEAQGARCLGTNPNYKARVTQLSMFGCNPTPSGASPYYGVACGPQNISLQGNASTLGYFSYFPFGNIQLQGNADVEGVIWSNNLQSIGSGDFIVPASGVNEAFELLGLNPGVNNDCSTSIYGNCQEEFQPKWDFVARSVRRFSFKFG